MRIVLDTNVLVRAAPMAHGLASKLLRTILGGPHRLLISPFILGEVSRVLSYPRLRSRWELDDGRIQGLVNRLAAAAEPVQAAD